MTSLSTDEYLSLVESLVEPDEDPDLPRGAALPTVNWRERLPRVFGMVIGGLVAVVLAGAGVGAVISHAGSGQPRAVASRAVGPSGAAQPFAAGSGAAGSGAAGSGAAGSGAAGSGAAGSGAAGSGAAGSGAAGSPGGAQSHVVAGPLGAVQEAQFQLDSGIGAVVVRTADLGDTLFRAVTPDSSSVVPRVSTAGNRVRVRVAPGGGGSAPGQLEVALNSRVAWQVSLVGGSASATVDLRGATVRGVDFVGGVERIELWLAAAHGAVPVRMSGGARDMTVHAPQGVPVQVAIGDGAATVTVDGAPHSGIPPGTRFVTTGWQQARDRYDMDMAGGIAQLTIDRY